VSAKAWNEEHTVSGAFTPAAHDLGGAEHTADVLADVNAKISDATLLDTGDIQFKTGALHAAADHENAGGLEVNVGGLSGLLADDQHVLDAEVLAVAAALVHAARHQNAGADEISVAGLSGELADDQPSYLSTTHIGFTAYMGLTADYLALSAEFANVWYGDGVADDVQINAIIAYVDGLGGGDIHYDEGNYNIAALVDFTNTQYIRNAGASWRATNWTCSAAMAIMVRLADGVNGSDNITFEHIFFDGNANANSIIDVIFGGGGCPDLLVDHCRFFEGIDYAISNGQPTEIVGCEFNYIGSDGGDVAINADAGSSWRIHDCTFSNNWRSITIQNNTYAMLENNSFYDDNNISIYMNAANSRAKIVNTVINGNNTTPTGIEDQSTGSTIQGFYIYDCATEGIRALGTLFNISDGFINGNSNTTYGIHLTTANAHGVLADLTITGCGGGIAANGSTYVTVDGCVCFNNGWALQVWGDGIDY